MVKTIIYKYSKKKAPSKKKTPIKKEILSYNKIKNNIVIKKGYCQASIMDENEIEDPCDIHKSLNECENETKDTNFWRSYECKWKQ